MRSFNRIVLFVFALGLFSCAAMAADAPAAPAKKSLYDRIGGLPAIAAVTDDFVARLATDSLILANKKVAEAFTKVNVTLLKFHVINQVCAAVGGPCKYTGRTMADSHKGLAITKAEWDEGVKQFVATLNHLSVPAPEQSELIAVVGSLEKDIVGK